MREEHSAVDNMMVLMAPGSILSHLMKLYKIEASVFACRNINILLFFYPQRANLWEHTIHRDDIMEV